MSNIPDNAASNTPNLGELFQRYLQRQVAARSMGLGQAEHGSEGDVLPYEAVPAQPIEPRLAWTETVLALQTALGSGADGVQGLAVPPEWSNLIALQESCAALSFSAGNYPQRVRNLQPLLQAKRLSDLCVRQTRPVELDALTEWARKTCGSGTFPEVLLALGALRACRQFNLAKAMIEARATVPPQAQGAWDNERAALAWEMGETEQARSMWNEQAASPEVLFNRGMAALFTDHAADARGPLSEAVRLIPERSGWHHLARLYLALAEMRANQP
jgi:hypothetical protein